MNPPERKRMIRPRLERRKGCDQVVRDGLRHNSPGSRKCRQPDGLSRTWLWAWGWSIFSSHDTIFCAICLTRILFWPSACIFSFIFLSTNCLLFGCKLTNKIVLYSPVRALVFTNARVYAQQNNFWIRFSHDSENCVIRINVRLRQITQKASGMIIHAVMLNRPHPTLVN